MYMQIFKTGARVVAMTSNHGHTSEHTGTVESFDQESGEYQVLLDQPVNRFGGPVQLLTYDQDELRNAMPWD